jgi:hypothetical protein
MRFQFIISELTFIGVTKWAFHPGSFFYIFIIVVIEAENTDEVATFTTSQNFSITHIILV